MHLACAPQPNLRSNDFPYAATHGEPLSRKLAGTAENSLAGVSTPILSCSPDGVHPSVDLLVRRPRNPHALGYCFRAHGSTVFLRPAPPLLPFRQSEPMRCLYVLAEPSTKPNFR
jgi:hypothetical protein